MLQKKNIDIESIIKYLHNKKLSANVIRKRLKPLLTRNLLPSLKVI